MASNTHPLISNGDSPRHKLQARAAKSPRESNITNKKLGTRHSGTTADGEMTSEMDGSEDDDNDDHDSNGDEEDVCALSGAQALDARQRLAGLQIEDVFVDDATQVVANATADDDADNESISDDDISESDLEDEAMNRAVEKDLIEEFESREHKRDVAKLFANAGANIFGGEPFGAVDNDDDDFDLFGDIQRFGTLDMNVDPYDGLAFESNEWHQMMLEAESAMSTRDRDITIPTARKNSSDSTDTKKRVRFMEPDDALSRSSSMSSSDDVDPSTMFPDLLEAATSVANSNHESLANSLYEDLDDAVSCYDFDGDEDALELDDDESTCDEADTTSDDSDDGDTTDEETEEEQLARLNQQRKRTELLTNVEPSTPSPSKKRPVPSRAATTPVSTMRTGKGPRMGTFTIDQSRACMSSDTISKQLQFIPPANPTGKDKAFWDRARSAANSRGSTPRSSFTSAVRTPGSEDLLQRPFTAQSTLSTMFDGNLAILSQNQLLAADFMTPPVRRPHSSYTPMTLTEDSDVEMESFNMHDFIDMDDDAGTESDGPSTTSLQSPFNGTSFDPFPSSPAFRNNSGGDRMLSHLSHQPSLVGSFRNNQHVAKHFSSMALHPAKRASASEYNALQKGRRAAANTPITPARKKRASQDFGGLTGSAGVRKSVSSPLAGRRPRSRGSSLSNPLQQTLGAGLESELQIRR